MSDWDWTVSVGTGQAVECNVDEIEFGDGYRQGVARGLNPFVENWSVVRKDIPNAVKEAMEALLRDRRGVATFTWTPPFSSTEIKVTCKAWQFTPKETPYWDLTATFRRRYE